MLFWQKTTAQKIERRKNRLARWNRPIQGPVDRLGAWWNALFVDFNLLRLIFPNRHQVSEEFWRSAQPLPYQVAWAARAGIKTIINLRGLRENGAFPLEAEACEQHHIAFVEIAIPSREAPSRQTIHALAELFSTRTYPVLVHCKAGADRAGLVSALYLILVQGKSVDEAIKQLASRYGHWRWSQTGILDEFLIRYRDEGESKGLSMLEWVETTYNPDELNAHFRSHAFSRFVTDKILRRE